MKELLVGDARKPLLIFAGAVAFVLLIACANVANLFLSRAASKQTEIAVRAALGAGRSRLVRQLLVESSLVSLAGGLVGVVAAAWGVRALLALVPAGTVPRLEEIRMDASVLGFTVVISLATGILFGLAPALRATRNELGEPLSRGARTVTRRHEGLRSALVVSQIALALVLLTGAGLMLRSFRRIRTVDPGFQSRNVLTMTVDLPASVYSTAADMQRFHQATLERLSSIPGVSSAAAVNWRPFGAMLIRGDFEIEGGRQLPQGFLPDKLTITTDYFRTMGIRQMSGRDFTERDHASAPGVVIVSQSVARRLWAGENAIGKRISMENRPRPQDWLTIIGVVDDVRQQGLTEDRHPAIYLPYLQVGQPGFLSYMTFVVHTESNPQGTASAMRSALRGVDANQPAQSIEAMTDVIAASTAEPLFQTRLLAAFSLSALMLSAIGIYGSLAYSVAERWKELGLRMALGAQRGDVVRMVLRRALLLAGAGVALGAAGALAITRVLARLLYEVRPDDPATLAGVAGLLTAIALFAAFLPARRATQVNPMVALRCD